MLQRLLLIIAIVGISVVSQAQLVSVSISADQTQICEGDSVQLSLTLETIGDPYLSVEWTSDGDYYTENDFLPVVSPEVSTVYYAVVSDTVNEISIQVKIKIAVVPRPIVIAPEDMLLCSNESVTLTPLQLENTETHEWSHNGQGSFSNSESSVSVTYVPAADETGEIMFVLTGGGIDVCEDVSDTCYVTYSPATAAEILNQEEFVCGNSTLELEGIADNYDSIVWSHDGDGELTDINTLTPTYIPDSEESGIVNVVLKAIGVACVKTDTFSFEVSAVSIEFDEELIACEGDRVVLNITSLSTVSYEWSTGETGNKIIVDAEYSNVYVATVTNDLGCTTEAIIRLEVIETPVISLTSDVENNLLTAYPSNLTTYEFYDDSTGELLQSSSSNTFDYSDYLETVTTISVIGENEYGCVSDSEGDNSSNIYSMPGMIKVNAFSPNDDGINDSLMPGRKIKVFDRTNKILYEGWDGWDGTYNGKKLPQGTYFYILYNGNEIYYKGPVSILR